LNPVSEFEFGSVLIYRNAMHAVVYSFTTLWVAVAVILMLWDGYLSIQMINHRVPKERPWSWFGGRRFSFQTDPADYTEVGQAYRRKSIRVEMALLAWIPIIPIALSIIYDRG
jgi:hypothetical protein